MRTILICSFTVVKCGSYLCDENQQSQQNNSDSDCPSVGAELYSYRISNAVGGEPADGFPRFAGFAKGRSAVSL